MFNIRRVGFFALLMLVAVLVKASLSEGKVGEASGDIDKVIREHFRARAQRDLPALKKTIDEPFIGIESGNRRPNSHCTIEVFSAKEGEKLLPPAGNDDWEKVTIDEITSKVSEPDGSTAVATFVIRIPVGVKEVNSLKRLLEKEVVLEPREKEFLDKAIKTGSYHHTMVALLAWQRGAWKIVALSFPH